MNEPGLGNPGPATDRHNEPVVDPTANVLQLVEAAITRQDDLRESDRRHRIELAAMRLEFNREIRDLERDLRVAETARIDAIRAVDAQAVQQGRLEAETRATALAATVVQSAEAMRNQVAATATAAETRLASALEPIQKRLDDLTRSQAEAVGGKSQVVESRGATGAVIGYVVGGIGAFVAVATLLVVLLSNPPA